MRIEHVALNVEDPLPMARWYVEHLGFTVKRRMVDAPWTHFLADDTGNVMIELYKNSDAPIPDYGSMNPFSLHLALISADVRSDTERLTAAGAVLDGEILETPGGDVMAMLRDPWGFTVQLVKRETPMI